MATNVGRTRGGRGETTGPEKFAGVFERIYKLVLRIPRGRVMTYGQIARLLDERYSPRLVGWAMHVTPDDGRNIPWHRVINSRGAISTGRVMPAQPDRQRWMLEAEGVQFAEPGLCDLSIYQWSPRRRRSSESPALKGLKPTKPRRGANRRDTPRKLTSVRKASRSSKSRS